MSDSTVMPVRQRRNREAEVLDAAIDVFWRKGYSAASVQEVADAVGVLKGSLYHYISSKEELLFRIFDGSHQDALAIMEEVSALDVGPLERLHEYVVRFVTYYVENIKRVGLYYREWRFIEGEHAKDLREQRRDYDRFLMGLIDEAQARGEIPASVDPKLTAFYLMAAFNGIADWYRPAGPLSAADIAARYADLALATVRNAV
jgi:TetR/AcrR family transcriptional regulator, cholesterol catabolism regulator